MPRVTQIETISHYIGLLDKANKLSIPVSINGVFQDVKIDNHASIEYVEEKLLEGCRMSYIETKREIAININPKGYNNEDLNVKFYSE